MKLEPRAHHTKGIGEWESGLHGPFRVQTRRTQSAQRGANKGSEPENPSEVGTSRARNLQAGVLPATIWP